MVLGLIVLFDLKAESSLPKFVEAFRPLINSANTLEPECLTYELHVAAGNPRRLIVIERYVDRAALKDVHERTPAFQALMAFNEAHGDEIEKVEAIESNDIDTVFSAASAAQGSAAPGEAPNSGVLVFCGARPGSKPEYMAEAAKVGALIAARGSPLIYGGGTMGVMGAVAQGALSAGGEIRSVIPRALKPREVSGEMLGTVYYTHTMGERKSLMFDMASTVIALPGGWGTFDELLEALTLFQLNAYRPKIGVLNVANFFDPFLALLQHMIDNGFLEERARSYFVVASTADELFARLDEFERPPSAANLHWTKKP